MSVPQNPTHPDLQPPSKESRRWWAVGIVGVTVLLLTVALNVSPTTDNIPITLIRGTFLCLVPVVFMISLCVWVWRRIQGKAMSEWLIVEWGFALSGTIALTLQLAGNS